MSPRVSLLTMFFALLLAACSGTGPQAPEEEPAELPEPREVTDMAAYEEFDAAPYREDVPEVTRDLAHDVPAVLMQGTAGSGELVTRQGYRIQVLQTPDRDEANAELARLEGLFRDAEEPMQVYLVYRQPYYRVRVGNFATQDDAQAALPRVSDEYPGALVVPDRVQVRR